KNHPNYNRFREYLEQRAETDTDYSQNQEVKNNIESEQIKYIVKQNDEEITIDDDLSSDDFNFPTEKQAFKQALEKNYIKKCGFITDADAAIKKIRNHNMNLMQQYQATIDKYEQQIREFSLYLLISGDKKIWLSRKNNTYKDFYDYFQATGGAKEKNKIFEEYACREALEEANIELKKLIFV
ncbi:10305_t:CDS:2, partial [Racocetra fulgida]